MRHSQETSRNEFRPRDPGPDHTADDKAPAAAPVASEAPLSDAEVKRLVELRRLRVLSDEENTELMALSDREHIPQPPLTDEERERLLKLSEPRILTDDEQAEIDALSRRAEIPKPPAPGEPIHGLLDMIIAELGALAARVTGAHDFGPRIDRLRTVLESVKAARK
jgi:hypothetical protein